MAPQIYRSSRQERSPNRYGPPHSHEGDRREKQTPRMTARAFPASRHTSTSHVTAVHRYTRLVSLVLPQPTPACRDEAVSFNPTLFRPHAALTSHRCNQTGDKMPRLRPFVRLHNSWMSSLHKLLLVPTTNRVVKPLCDISRPVPAFPCSSLKS